MTAFISKHRLSDRPILPPGAKPSIDQQPFIGLCLSSQVLQDPRPPVLQELRGPANRLDVHCGLHSGTELKYFFLLLTGHSNNT